MPNSLSRNALLVKFFAQAYPKIPRKHLVKYIYEADILAREYLGRPLSTFTYRRDKYGPYDHAIEDAVTELMDAGLVDPERDPWYRGGVLGGAYHRLVDRHQTVAFDFNLGESAVLDYVVRNYIDMDFKEFMRDVIYESPPMKANPKMGAVLDMRMVDHAGTRKVGFDLHEVLAAEEAGRQGEFITLSDFVDELRTQAPA